MIERQYLNRAVVIGGVVGLVVAGALWFGFGSALFDALAGRFMPVAVLVWVLPPFVAGLFAGAIRRTDQSDAVVTAGTAAGGLTALGILFFVALPNVLRVPLAAMEWLASTLADPSVAAVETLVVEGLATLVGATLVGFLLTTLALIPGLCGGLVAYGLRIRSDTESGLAHSEDAGS